MKKQNKENGIKNKSVFRAPKVHMANLISEGYDDISIEIPSLFDNVTPQRNDQDCEQDVESSTVQDTNYTSESPEKLTFEMLMSTYRRHGLVFMFQPFQGKWIQTLGCFLSRGCASGAILHKLIIECIALLEDAGFYADVVVTDGASWNRTMWKKFGVDEHTCSCQNPVDDTRQLWFASDFPHLIKCFRNRVVQQKIMTTPDGVIRTAHWDAVVEKDNSKSYTLKVCHKLKHAHVHPKPYQKINVAMAFQVFATGMRIYKNQVPNLQDCEGTIAFIERMNALIDVMNARSPLTAMRNGTIQRQVGLFANINIIVNILSLNNVYYNLNMYNLLAKKFTTCEACLETLLNVTANPCPEQDLLITLKSRGGLLHPFNQMFRLCSVLEDAVTKVLSSENINNNTLFEVVDLLEEIEIPKIGCKADEHVLTVSIVKFYLIMRMHFACTRFNEINKKNREKTKILRKQSKL
ncbi:THAP domain-containing protein 9 [Trachymyrmex cornetzi]|uniref:THAP domain-containing protein 9 n=1 Tax=Trachymyrmex cornetzi TaxID=471704 RepID=A0A151J5Q7_9HYME|nr:THAP domain-containing protein 9 [Trachymyrmex cornetzi]